MFDIVANMLAGTPSEDHQVKQTVGTQSIGAMHGDTRRLTDGHQPRDHRLRIAVLDGRQQSAPLAAGWHRNQRRRNRYLQLPGSSCE